MRIEGYAVISEDGMIADASGVLPPQLIADADQRFFEEALNQVDIVVHGRNSAEQQPNSAKRRRIIVTRNVAAIAPDPANAKAVLWNPSGAMFEDAIAMLNTPIRSAAILGGTDVFDLFLGRYTVFFLSRIAGIRLPGGRPVFPHVPTETPEAVLIAHGLHDQGCELSDPAARLIISRWERPA
jgi:dihydrofolate reductase